MVRGFKEKVGGRVEGRIEYLLYDLRGDDFAGAAPGGVAVENHEAAFLFEGVVVGFLTVRGNDAGQ